MEKYSLILKTFIKSLADKQSVKETSIYSTFLAIPELILNSHQKLICEAFMLLSESAEIIKNNRLQLSVASIGSLTGLTRDQAYRAITGLEISCINVMKSGVLAVNESIRFEIKKEKGISSNYEFEYLSPQIQKKIGIQLNQDPPPILKDNKTILFYDKNADPMYLHKTAELKRLAAYFSGAQIAEFLKFDFHRIVFVIDYFFESLNSKPGRKLNYKWISDAFGNYDIKPDVTRERMLQEIGWLNKLHIEIKNLADTKQINIKHLNLSVNGYAPKYVFSTFQHIAKLQDCFLTNLEKLNELQMAELTEVTPRIYEILQTKFRMAGLKTLEDAKRYIEFSIINKHLNLI